MTRMATGETGSDSLRQQALTEAMKYSLRSRVLAAVAERPGVTINQLASRLGEPPRKVRHHLERLVKVDLVRIDSSTRKRNTREHHYKAVLAPRVSEEEAAALQEEDRHRIALTVARLLVEDMRQSIDGRVLASRPGHSMVRIPGEVDELGWEELAEIAQSTTKAIEEAMRGSARRLAVAGERGTSVVSAVMVFESRPWPADAGEGGAPPSESMWLTGPGS
jgi:DNA-binding transcriptional ArsR family regulator